MMIRSFPRGKLVVFTAIIVSAIFALRTHTPQMPADSQVSATTFVPITFSGKASLAIPEVTPAVTYAPAFDAPDEDAMRLAAYAMELKYEELNVALHMMSKALNMDNHPDIREMAADLLSLTSFTFREDMRYEGNSINSLAVSPDGDLIAIGDDYGQITILSSEGTELSSPQSEHENTIDALSFSPDGKYLAAGSHDDYFSIWKVEGSEIELDARHYYGDDWVRSLVFSPDGSELYVAGDVYYSLVYNMESRAVTDTLGDHEYYVYAIDVSDDGEVIATGDGDGLLKIWTRGEDGWEEEDYHYLSAKVSDVVFDEDRMLYVAMADGSIMSLDLSDPGNAEKEFVTEEGSQEYNTIAIVGEDLVSGGEGRRIEVFGESASGTALIGDYIYEIEDYDGTSFLVGTSDYLVRGVTSSQETISVDDLKAGEGLEPLSLEEKVEFNLWEESDVANLEAEEQVRLFSTLSDILEGYSWEYTDKQRIADLTFSQAEKAVAALLDSPDNIELGRVVSAAIPVLGRDQSIFAKAFTRQSKASEAVMWLSLGSNYEVSEELKKYAGRRAYAIAPGKEWGQIVESGLSASMAQLEEADFQLTYGCDANSIMFSPDGSYLFVTTDRGEDCEGGYLYPVENGVANEGRSIEYPHQSNIMWQGAFSIDGQRIASASTDGTVIIYNLNGGTEHIFAYEEGEVGFSDARILRDGTVITADNNGMILQWTLGNIVPDKVIAEHESEARKLAVIRDETVVLSVGYEGLLYVHDLQSGETETISANYNGIDDISVNNDETKALLGYVGGGAGIVDLESWEITPIRETESNDYQCAAFAGEYYLFGTDAGAIKIYNEAGSLLFTKQIHDGTVYDIHVSPDGKYVATAGGDDRATIWSLESLIGASVSWTSVSWKEQDISAEDWGELLSVTGRASSEDDAADFIQSLYDDTPKGAGKDALKTAIDNSLFFQLDGKKVKPKGGLKMFTGFPEGLNGIHYSSTLGTAIALGDAGGIFELDENGGFDLIANIPNSEPRCFTELSNGGWAVAEPGYVYILDENFEIEEELEPHSQTIYDITLSADGSYLATASADYDLSLIETDNFSTTRVRGHDNEANAVAFFRDGSGFVSGADDQTVKFWDMNGNLKRSSNVGANIWTLDISPDGDRIAAGTNEGEIILLDGSGTEYKRWSPESFAYWAITFSPDGQTFTAGNNDGGVSVWGRNGEVKFSFDTGESTIFEIAYSTDGKYIFVATTDGEVYRFMVE